MLLRQPVNDVTHDESRAVAARLDNEVGHLTVQWVARLQQLTDPLARVVVGGQHGSIAIVGGALLQDLKRGVQVDDKAVGDELGPILRPVDHPAPGRENNTTVFTKLLEHRCLAGTEPVLAFELEDQRDVGSRALLELEVTVEKLFAKLLGKLAPDSRLSCAHRAHQVDVFRIGHRVKLIDPGTKEYPAATGRVRIKPRGRNRQGQTRPAPKAISTLIQRQGFFDDLRRDEDQKLVLVILVFDPTKDPT